MKKKLTHIATKQKLSLLMTLLMSVSVFGGSANVLAKTETSSSTKSKQKVRRFGPVIEASGKKGSKRSIGELDAMIPVFESESTLGLIDVKAKLDSNKSKEEYFFKRFHFLLYFKEKLKKSNIF